VILDDDIILRTLVEEERLELSRINKLFGFHSFIKPTEELAGDYKLKPGQIEFKKTFKPSVWDLISVAAVLLFLAGGLIYALINQSNLNSGAYILIPLVLIFLFTAFLLHYFNKNKNFKIVITHNDLTIRDRSYNWNEIYKTYIITRPKQKESGHKYFLVIILQNGSADRYDFTNLVNWESTVNKLAGYIEYYKAQPGQHRATAL
jgi:hypothetical protein